MTVDEFVLKTLGDNKMAFMTAEKRLDDSLFHLLTALIANEEGRVQLLNSSVNDKLWDYSAPAFVNGVAKLQQ